MRRSCSRVSALIAVPFLLSMVVAGQTQAQQSSSQGASSGIGSQQSQGMPSERGSQLPPKGPPGTEEQQSQSGGGQSRHTPPEMEPPNPSGQAGMKPLKGKPVPGAVTLVIINRLDRKVTLNGVLQHMARGINLAKPVQITLEPGATMRPVFQLDDTRLLDQHSHWKLALAGEGLPSGKILSGMLQKTGRTIEITPAAIGMQKQPKHPDGDKDPRKPIPDQEEWRKDPRKRPDGDKDPRKPIPDEDEWRKDPRKRPDGDKDPRKPSPDEDEWRKDPRKRPDGDKDPRKPI
nr:hypothetical protein [Candidatus Ozemobacteraceae bacterium]